MKREQIKMYEGKKENPVEKGQKIKRKGGTEEDKGRTTQIDRGN